MALYTVISTGGGDYTTISAAMAAAVTNDIVEIRDNATYVEQVVFAVDGVTLQAGNGFHPIIQYTTSTIVLNNNVIYSTIQDLDVRTTGGGTTEVVYMTGGNDNFISNRCSCTGNIGYSSQATQNGIIEITLPTFTCLNAIKGAVWGDLRVDYPTATLTGASNCFLRTNTVSGYITRGNVTGLNFCLPIGSAQTYATLFSVENNYFVMAGDGYFIRPSSDNCLVYYNTVVGPGGALGTGIDMLSNTFTNVLFENNILKSLGVGIITGKVWGGDYNCLFNTLNYAGTAIPGTHDVLADPVLTGYQIGNSSPCLNVGINVGVTTDILGTIRPQGTGYDIGCFELASPHLIRAYHIGEQAIRAVFTMPVQQTDFADPSDSTYLPNWSIVRTDSKQIPMILDVIPGPDAYSVDLWLAGIEIKKNEFATLTASTSIVSSTGYATSTPNTYLYEGSCPLDLRLVVINNPGMMDLASPTNDDGLVINSAGDYQMGSPKETMKKLVLRVLMTSSGEFTYLPAFGAAPQEKSTATRENLSRVAENAKSNILALPGVRGCEIQVRSGNDGILTIIANVSTIALGTLTVPYTTGSI